MFEWWSVTSPVKNMQANIKSSSKEYGLEIKCGNYKEAQKLDMVIQIGDEKTSFTTDSPAISAKAPGGAATININLYTWDSWSSWASLDCVLISVKKTQPTTTTKPTKATTALTPKPGTCSCGKSNKATRVIGGVEVAGREFPWIMYLITTNSEGKQGACGSSLVTTKHAVTAAHCTKGGVKFEVIAGVNDLYDLNKVVTTAKAIDHPKYDSDTMQNDIAFLTLDTPMTFSATISPICLADPALDYTGKTAVQIGWGRWFSDASKQPASPSKLQKLVAEIAPNSVCERSYRGFDKDSMTCCQHIAGKGVCQGDSGGPLNALVGSVYHLYGIVSFGSSLTCIEDPAIFVKAQNYVAWVKEQIANNGGGKNCA